MPFPTLAQRARDVGDMLVPHFIADGEAAYVKPLPAAYFCNTLSRYQRRLDELVLVRLLRPLTQPLFIYFRAVLWSF
jgi:hypothetical protein